MKPSTTLTSWATRVFALCVLSSSLAYAQNKLGTVILNRPFTPIAKQADDPSVAEIEMFVGESRVFPAPGVARIAVGNGNILNASPLDGKEVILFANAVGTSSLFIWNQAGQSQRVKVNIVQGDTSRFAREIASFLAAIPSARASVIGDKVIVEGDRLSDVDMARIDLLSKRYPQIVNFTNPLGFERMVKMDVKVVEFPVTELREVGLRWGSTGGVTVGGVWAPVSRGDAPGLKANVNANSVPISTENPNLPLNMPNSLNIRSAVNLGLNATLQLLAQEGKTVILAAPQLSARSGSKASFLAGGEIPYSVSNENGTTIVYKPYGVKLDILPRVDAGGTIRATIETEVSNIDGAVSTPFGPALLTRKTSTEFNVRSGETIVLSGLIQREQLNSADKVAGLGEVPILGALFRSKKFLNKETELVVFVTPTVIDAAGEVNQKLLESTEKRLENHLGPAPHIRGDASESTLPGVHSQDSSESQSPDVDIDWVTPSGVLADPITLEGIAHHGAAVIIKTPLPLMLTADINAPVKLWLSQGQAVYRLNVPAKGEWIAVDAGDTRGWVSISGFDIPHSTKP